MLRNKYNIKPTCCGMPACFGAAVGDYCTQCCCFHCAMCQETNEFYARGLRSLPGQVPAGEAEEGATAASEPNPVAEGETTPMLDKNA